MNQLLSFRPSFRNLLLLLSIVVILTSTAGNPISYQDDICTGPFESVSTPLTELGNQPYLRMDGTQTQFTGGLYPNGSNTRPPAHEAAGLAASSQIQPLNTAGMPDPDNGRIVMVSIGMSNTGMEFGAFINQVNNTPGINPHLLLVNGALASQTADRWVDPNALAWLELDQRLESLQVSPQQVQVAWVKLTLTRGGEFPAKAVELQAALETITHNLKDRFPNLQIAYFSSRIRSYTYYRGLSPEPLAFETGFSVKWMIEKQIQGDPSLNFDPALGEVNAPFLSWGPYLWADGQNPRADGLVWLPQDLTSDCTHPTQSGVQKVSDMLLNFYTTDTTARTWFMAGSPSATLTPTRQPTATRQPEPTATQTLTQTPTTPGQPTVTSAPINPTPTLQPNPNPGDSNSLYLTLIFGSTLLVGGWLWLRLKGPAR